MLGQRVMAGVGVGSDCTTSHLQSWLCMAHYWRFQLPSRKMLFVLVSTALFLVQQLCSGAFSVELLDVSLQPLYTRKFSPATCMLLPLLS